MKSLYPSPALRAPSPSRGEGYISFNRGIKAILLCLSLFGLAACSATAPHATHQKASSQGIFRMNLGAEPPSLDPARMSDLYSETVVLNLMRGLTQFSCAMNQASSPAMKVPPWRGGGGDFHDSPENVFKKGGQIEPAVASRWEISPDGLTYTFHLRPDARWSDGKPVTAKDFLYAWQRALNPAIGSDYAFFLFGLKNAKAYYDKKITDFSQVGVSAPNPQTLIVRLEHPSPFFLELLASPVMLPLRRDLIEKYGDNFTEAGHFLSNGPYLLSQWRHDDRLFLTPNSAYYGRKPVVSGVLMLMINDPNTSVVMYENNELDFIESGTSIPTFDIRRLRKSPDAHEMPLYKMSYFGFNTRKPPMNNVKVRQAFAYALDRRYFPKLLQSGQQPMRSWISPGLVGYNPEIGIPFNPQKAKRLLAEAGYPDGKGFPLVSLAFMTQYDLQKEMEIAQYLWKKYLNVNVRLENMEWKVLMSRLRQDTPALFRLQWFVDYPDPDSFMNVFISGSGNNNTGWKNQQYDHWVAEAAVSQDPAKRIMLYNQAQQLLLEKETAILPIYTGEKIYLTKPWVSGLDINALNLLYLDDVAVSSSRRRAASAY